MFEDRMILGIIAGVVGNIPKLIVAWSLYWLGYVQYLLVHIGAGLFVSKVVVKQPLSVLLGSLVDFGLASILGIALVYVAVWTSPRYLILKGIFLGLAMFIVGYGLATSAHLTTVDLRMPIPNLLEIIPHIVIGASTGWFIQKYGDL